MRKVLYRFFVDFEKEEKWINGMGAQGWHLEKFSFARFAFKKGEPGAFIYRNEFISGMSSADKKDYFEFLKDSGISIINEMGGWVYMKKAAADGPFEIYTDTKSKISYYKRMLNIFALLFFINAWMGIANISIFGDKTSLEFVNQSAGIFNIAAAILIAFPILKIIKCKRSLEKDQQFFE